MKCIECDSGNVIETTSNWTQMIEDKTYVVPHINILRCQQCGECCSKLKHHSQPVINGVCIHLVDEPGTGRKKCNIALYRPRTCGNDPSGCKHITHNIVPCE